MIPVAAPPRVRDRLSAAADGPLPVLHHTGGALYVDVGGWCVGVVTTGVTRVPNALRLPPGQGLPVPHRPGRPAAYLERGTLHLGSTPLPVGRLEAPRVPRLGDGELPRNTACPATVQVTPPTTVAGFVATHLPDRRIDAAAVPRLIGRGEGLTPLGDDVLAGWVALHRAAGIASPEVDDAVRAHAARTTLLSATLLDCAAHGEVLPEYAAWVAALGTPDEADRARALHRVGATSGAGLHQGALIALDQLQEAA
ncbi:DUF2877 domain-containing protein [Nocardioides coralli]|uniref:oxamate carbamoyltransferase subunit AllH family protein n=1 Tax=Nocardioides coralli TaxID=2872154 RepID=UPI001CA3E071|nr:DUF2877 domain-containing protein [Nocardioides coralli]QZY30068.1 DUF2877 domain-containing protein [Nocardioides coralli]